MSLVVKKQEGKYNWFFFLIYLKSVTMIVGPKGVLVLASAPHTTCYLLFFVCSGVRTLETLLAAASVKGTRIEYA